MPIENDGLLQEIRTSLTPAKWTKFTQILQAQQNSNIADDAGQDIIWQALYLTDPVSFYSIVLPPLDKSLRGLALGTKYTSKQIYTCADRVIAASNEFHAESDTKSISRAWDMVAKAYAQARADEKKYLAQKGHSTADVGWQRLHQVTNQYKYGSEHAFYYILRTRPVEMQEQLVLLYADENLSRRDKRLKKYLFSNVDPKVIEKLNKKNLRLDAETQAAGQQKVAAQIASNVGDIRAQLPKAKGKKSMLHRMGASVGNAGIDAMVKGVYELGVASGVVKDSDVDLAKEVSTLPREAQQFIVGADGVFDIGSNTLQISSLRPGKVLDPKNIPIKEILNVSNIWTTVKHNTKEGVQYHILSNTEMVRDQGIRGARILGFIIFVSMVFISVGVVVAYPPIMPFVIAANVFLAFALGSFFYFNRDPIAKVANDSKIIVPGILDGIYNSFKPQHKQAIEFDMPDATRVFLQNLEPAISQQLERHFKKRAVDIKAILAKANADNDIVSTTEEIDKLEADWQQILTAANTGNEQEFCTTMFNYLKKVYATEARPRFIELAKTGNPITFSAEKEKIKELEALADQVNFIKAKTKRA